MVQKFCNTCHEYSFSACEHGTWICPICGRDLTEDPVEVAVNVKSYPAEVA